MDKNGLSFTGPEFNGKTVDWSHLDIDLSDIDDTIKCTGQLKDFTLKLGRVVCGREDALDVNNRCSNVTVIASQWVFPKGKAKIGFTVKGGSTNIQIVGAVDGDPLLDIGNASDQSHLMTTGVGSGLWRLDGKPIRVRVLGGERPKQLGGKDNFDYVFPWSWLPFCHLVNKVFLQIRRMPILRRISAIRQQ